MLSRKDIEKLDFIDRIIKVSVEKELSLQKMNEAKKPKKPKKPLPPLEDKDDIVFNNPDLYSKYIKNISNPSIATKIKNFFKKKDKYLSFGFGGNAKLKKLGVSYFSLPAGFTCPFAEKCLKKAVITHLDTGEPYKGSFTITDKEMKKLNLAVRFKFGDKSEYDCYASTAERNAPARISRWKNYSLLVSNGKTNAKFMYSLILESLNRSTDIIKSTSLRIHDSGDFFNEAYFVAWLNVAKKRSDVFFYAYTKSLPYWKKYRDDIPTNFKLIASQGGSHDKLINEEGFRQAIVMYTVEEAKKSGLAVDFSEAEAIVGDKDFVLLLHGQQGKETSGKGSDSLKNGVYINQLYEKYGESIDKQFIQNLVENLLRPYEIGKPIKWIGEKFETNDTEEINESTILLNDTLSFLDRVLGV